MSHEEDADDSLTSASTAPTVKLIPLELLRCEEAFYWRCLSHYLHSKGVKGDELLESIVPTISNFCDYIERYACTRKLNTVTMNRA